MLHLQVEPRRARALRHRRRHFAQAQPRHDDGIVGRDEVLRRAVLERTPAACVLQRTRDFGNGSGSTVVLQRRGRRLIPQQLPCRPGDPSR